LKVSIRDIRKSIEGREMSDGKKKEDVTEALNTVFEFLQDAHGATRQQRRIDAYDTALNEIEEAIKKARAAMMYDVY
jgi:hypothetical protein